MLDPKRPIYQSTDPIWIWTWDCKLRKSSKTSYCLSHTWLQRQMDWFRKQSYFVSPFWGTYLKYITLEIFTYVRYLCERCLFQNISPLFHTEIVAPEHANVLMSKYKKKYRFLRTHKNIMFGMFPNNFAFANVKFYLGREKRRLYWYVMYTYTYYLPN
jgi:hypothetical protein